MYQMIREHQTNDNITRVIHLITEQYQACEAVEGVLSHEMQRYLLDGEKVILNRHDHDSRVPLISLQKNDVFAMDICLSSGSGKVGRRCTTGISLNRHF